MQRDSELWVAWPVNWSAIWIGALSALAVGLLIGLIGIAVGAHETSRFVDWKKVHLIEVVFNVAGAFFAFVVGGWVAARVAGIIRAEPAILVASVVWLLAIPMLLVLAALGAGGYVGSWYGSLAGVPAWVAAVPPADPEFARAVRGTALATLAAMLIGLIGAVIGGWLASGEPMTFTYYRRREVQARHATARV
jgi:hypothetical protein